MLVYAYGNGDSALRYRGAEASCAFELHRGTSWASLVDATEEELEADDAVVCYEPAQREYLVVFGHCAGGPDVRVTVRADSEGAAVRSAIKRNWGWRAGFCLEPSLTTGVYGAVTESCGRAARNVISPRYRIRVY